MHARSHQYESILVCLLNAKTSQSMSICQDYHRLTSHPSFRCLARDIFNAQLGARYTSHNGKCEICRSLVRWIINFTLLRDCQCFDYYKLRLL